MSDYTDRFGADTRIFGNPDECSRDEIVENVVEWLSHGGEYYIYEARGEYGEWLVDALHEDDRLSYHEGYRSWAMRQNP